MNVILIPFFLAANVVVNDTSEWTFGPEYLYDLNITYILNFHEHHKPEQVQLISTVKCRPKMPDNLFCYLTNFTESDNYNITREILARGTFEIKFNKHGVKGLIIDLPLSNTVIVNILRKIANQFNVIVDQGKIGMSQFTTRENSSMGNCATTYDITREKLETDTLEKENADFRLVILPLADAKPGTTLSIEKSRTECINSPRYIDFTMEILEMERFVSKIQIHSNKFETFTEFDGKAKRLVGYKFEVSSLKELIQINLNSIKPAQNKLPTLLHGKLIDFNFK
ncbi:uncharacterized protein LOC143906230 [Temnothorax americanus]|uniref:uncharacterized protein LOC143906230 n=1 Tax=Temnothorax americanus TaxID=1964332 RepID=UPI0040677FF2